jgi:hypothetical protein
MRARPADRRWRDRLTLTLGANDMTDRDLISSFDKTARFYPSGIDGTPCVEFKIPGSNYYTTSTVEAYAKRIRAFQKRGW